MDSLPNEILEYISKFLNLCSVKRFSQTSKRIYEACQRRIWSHPRFSAEVSTSDISKILKNKPVLEIHSEDFYYIPPKWIKSFQTLQKLHLDVVHLYALNPETITNFGVFLEINADVLLSRGVLSERIKLLKKFATKLVSISNYRINFICKDHRRWMLNQVEIFKNNRIGVFDTSILYVEVNMVEKLIKFLVQSKPEEVRLYGMCLNLEVRHLEELNKNNVKIKALHTEVLIYQPLYNAPLPWKVFMEMKHLVCVTLESMDLFPLEIAERMRIKCVTLSEHKFWKSVNRKYVMTGYEQNYRSLYKLLFKELSVGMSLWRRKELFTVMDEVTIEMEWR